jgi:superfamily I DNA/RNA helicase
LLVDEELSPNQIVVLLLGYPKKEYYRALTVLPLPQRIVWALERHDIQNSIVVDTVKRYKGLEAPIVFLWAGSMQEGGSDELRYVGLSRAKSRLYVVGTDDTASDVLQQAAK